MNGVKPSDIMSRAEIATVLDSLTKRARKSLHAHQRLVLFRLTIGAGLRISEIKNLDIEDVFVAGDRPHIRIRKGCGKGGKPRTVPLWWDCGTWDACALWIRVRMEEMGALATDPFICTILDKGLVSNKAIWVNQPRSVPGSRCSRQALYNHWMTAVAILGKNRARQLHPHCGRHTFASYMLSERSLPEVRDALGHSNISTTSIYLHCCPELLDRRGNVFQGNEKRQPPPEPPPKPKPSVKPLPPPDLRNALPIDRGIHYEHTTTMPTRKSRQ